MRILLSLLILTTPLLLSAEETVGVIIPLTGDFAKYGQKVQASLENKKSANIDYVYDDEGCSPQKAITAYKKLTTIDNVKLFLGPWCGSPQTVVAPLLAQGDQLAILGSSAPRNVFSKSKGRMFSTQHSIEQESLYNAQKANEMGAKSAVIIFLDNDFSRAHEKAFRSEFKGTIYDTLTYSSLDAAILKSLAIKVRKYNPDMLYIPDAFPLMHGILKELANIGFKDKLIFSVYSAQSKDVLDAVGQHGEGLLYSYPKIGEKEALKYFPTKAAEVVNVIVQSCGAQDTTCMLQQLNEKYAFDANGVLEGQLGLKTIKDGQFQWHDK